MDHKKLHAGFITLGSVRGACPHIHRTEEAAARCLARDQRGCASQGGYSDRQIYRVDGDYVYESDGQGGEREARVCRSGIRGYYMPGGS